jgi:hypothetical protein
MKSKLRLFEVLQPARYNIPDTSKNRKWMKAYKARWKERLDQLEIWMVSYRIDVE